MCITPDTLFICLGGAAVLAGAAAPLVRHRTGGRNARTARTWRRGRHTVETVQGMFGPLRVLNLIWEDGQPVRVLASGRSFQSATYTAEDAWYVPVFEYYYLYDLMFELGRPVRNVLMLGGGGYSYPKWLLLNHPQVHIDVVEIDPAVTDLARRYFYLDRLEGLFGEKGTQEPGSLRLVQDDGRSYLDQANTRYDAILNDTFAGAEPPAELASVQAARRAHDLLAPGGAYLSNVIGSLDGRDAHYLRSVVRTLEQAFSHVYVVPCMRESSSRPGNNIVVATDSDVEFPVGRSLNTGGEDPILLDPKD